MEVSWDTLGLDPLHFVPATVALFSALVAWLLWAAYNHFFVKPQRMLRFFREQGVPGFEFKPFVGQLPDLIKARKMREDDPSLAASTDAGQWFFDQSKRFGTKAWTFMVGPSPRLVLEDPTAVRQAYTTFNENFVKAQALKNIQIMGEGLLTANGNHWTWQRRLINPAFSHREIKRIFPTMVHCAASSLSKLEERVRASPSLSQDINSVFSLLTLDIICRSAFGSQLESLFEDDLLDTLIKAVDEYLKFVGRSVQYQAVIPFFRYLPLEINRRVDQSHKIIRGVMQKIVSVRMARFKEKRDATTVHPEPAKESVGEDERIDLLEMMMGSTLGIYGDATQSSGKVLTKDLLMDNCLTFLLAGHETTAQLLTWTALLLSQHPDWQENGREEVNAVFEANGGNSPSFEELNELKIVGMILNETLRLYPPAGVMGRVCIKTTKLTEKITVPEGCDISVPIMVIHKSKDLWGEDAEQFNPNRFANGIGKASTNPHAFMPFSMGPRTCIGQNFAVAEAKVILALFLRKFKWTVAQEYEHYPNLAITIRPMKGMPLQLTVI